MPFVTKRSALRWARSGVGDRAVVPDLDGHTWLSLPFLTVGGKSQKVVGRGVSVEMPLPQGTPPNPLLCRPC